MDKGHLELMEDTKNEPYKIKGYTQNTKMQKPKQALKFKIKQTFLPLHKCINDGKLDRCKSAIVMVGMTHHPDLIFNSYVEPKLFDSPLHLSPLTCASFLHSFPPFIT